MGELNFGACSMRIQNCSMHIKNMAGAALFLHHEVSFVALRAYMINRAAPPNIERA
jgi:hypothetical protein